MPRGFRALTQKATERLKSVTVRITWSIMIGIPRSRRFLVHSDSPRPSKFDLRDSSIDSRHDVGWVAQSSNPSGSHGVIESRHLGSVEFHVHGAHVLLKERSAFCPRDGDNVHSELDALAKYPGEGDLPRCHAALLGHLTNRGCRRHVGIEISGSVPRIGTTIILGRIHLRPLWVARKESPTQRAERNEPDA